MRCRTLAILGLAGLAASVVLAKGGLDDGKLDPAWFGGTPEFREVDDIDYLWVKEGFSLKGHTLHIKGWEDPEFLGDEKRDAKDSAQATRLTESMAAMVRGALKNSLDEIAEVSKEEGDIAVDGRFVDCNAGSKAAKWLVGMGAGSASATWDMKLTDAATGELLVAIHHRAISGTTMSNIDDKVIKWLEELGDIAKADFAVYARGKKVKK